MQEISTNEEDIDGIESQLKDAKIILADSERKVCTFLATLKIIHEKKKISVDKSATIKIITAMFLAKKLTKEQILKVVGYM